MIALQNMRMSCDSTYLLDHKTDFGVKADELMTLLDDLLEQPGSKVVVFSQWVRMHELLVRRLEKKRIAHVLFHGGVEGGRRKALLDRFRDDDRCRAFLSTDAGGGDRGEASGTGDWTGARDGRIAVSSGACFACAIRASTRALSRF